jgi:hypothetical protein
VHKPSRSQVTKYRYIVAEASPDSFSKMLGSTVSPTISTSDSDCDEDMFLYRFASSGVKAGSTTRFSLKSILFTFWHQKKTLAKSPQKQFGTKQFWQTVFRHKKILWHQKRVCLATKKKVDRKSSGQVQRTSFHFLFSTFLLSTFFFPLSNFLLSTFYFPLSSSFYFLYTFYFPTFYSPLSFFHFPTFYSPLSFCLLTA